MKTQKDTPHAVRVLEWHGCYQGNMKQWIVPEAFTHPAKMAVNLCRKIMTFMIEKKMLKAGDTIIDPFGGTGLTGMVASHYGFPSISVELEQRFLLMSIMNSNKHVDAWEAANRPIPTYLKGDSRKLGSVLRKNGLAGMGIVTSPPFGEMQSGQGIAKNGYHNEKKRKGIYKRVAEVSYTPEHFSSKNISNLAVVTSPPYIGVITSDRCGIDFAKAKKDYPGRKLHEERLIDVSKRHQNMKYADGKKNIGNAGDKTYWEAMQKVYSECWGVLPAGGWMAIVVKDFVRDRSVFPFCDLTCQLLAQCGFRVDYRIHAMLTAQTGTEDMFTGYTKLKSRKSMFRRIQEAKGSPPINWEEVIICQKEHNP